MLRNPLYVIVFRQNKQQGHYNPLAPLHLEVPAVSRTGVEGDLFPSPLKLTDNLQEEVNTQSTPALKKISPPEIPVWGTNCVGK